MAAINAAFEVLSDPVQRQQYDSEHGISADRDPTAERPRRNSNRIQAKVVARHKFHKAPIYCINTHLSTDTVLTASFDNTVVQWKPDLSGPDEQWCHDGMGISHIAGFGPGAFVATGTSEHSLNCWHETPVKADYWRNTPKAWVVTCAGSPNGKLVVAGLLNGEARVYDAKHGGQRIIAKLHEQGVTAVAWSHDSKRFATGGADATVYVWNAQNGAMVCEIEQIRSTVTALAFDPNGKHIAVSAVDHSIRIFDLRSGLLMSTLFGHDRPIEALSFHPEGWLLASASRDGTVGLWNVKRGMGHGQINASHQAVLSVGFAKQGSLLLAGGHDKVLRVWSLDTL